MKKTTLWLNFIAGILLSVSALAQTVPLGEKMSVSDRMAKARAAKADKKMDKVTSQNNTGTKQELTPGNYSLKEAKATPADYQAPVIKSLKGPHGEVVHTGEKGGNYYINKNGNKTYLSSNQ